MLAEEMQRIRSLVDWGLSAEDDQELRRYCAGRGASSEERSRLLRRVFRDHLRRDIVERFYFAQRAERSQLSSLMAMAATLPAASDWFERLNVAPASGDGPALQQWLQDGTDGIVFVNWLTELESKANRSVASRREMLAFEEIEKEASKWLRSIVDTYHRAIERIRDEDAFLAREARREQEAAAREARAMHPPLQTPTPPSQTQVRRRKYGELPRQPEVVTVKKRSK